MLETALVRDKEVEAVKVVEDVQIVVAVKIVVEETGVHPYRMVESGWPCFPAARKAVVPPEQGVVRPEQGVGHKT